uniref:SCP2 domain-containing protein n=1 Tax=Angiostrongylus cantonensis TaxID=6313 RepID=A0A0K0D418_ANGCA
MLHRHISKKQICEITNSQDRRILAANLKAGSFSFCIHSANKLENLSKADEIGSVTCTYGVEITDVELSDPKVIKEGENMGLMALTAVAKSDAGRKLWEVGDFTLTKSISTFMSVIAPHVEEFARDVAENNPNETTDQNSADESVPRQSALIEQSPVDKEPNIDLNMDVDQLITIINMAIDEQLAKAVGRIFQINCSGVSPFFIDLKHLPGVCGKGVIPNADVVLEMNQQVFLKIISEELSPVNAYMKGSLKLTGQIQDAFTLKYLAERVRHLL